MKKILIVEDDRQINNLLCDFLSSKGYSTISSFDGADAIVNLRNNEDLSLVILDLMLPVLSGDSVLKEIRVFSNVPIIVISAINNTDSKVNLMSIGADDYITKPFVLDEVLARVTAVLRRYEKNEQTIKESKPLTFKNLILHTDSCTATVNGKPLLLTNKEFSILNLLLNNPTKLFSKSNLFETVWEESYIADDGTLKVHMSNLRAKLKSLDPDNEYIETVWGMGYRLVN